MCFICGADECGFDYSLSIGTIHNRVTAAVEKAREINQTQDLSSIGVAFNTPLQPQIEFLKLCPAYVTDEATKLRQFFKDHSKSTVKKIVEVVEPHLHPDQKVDIGIDYLSATVKDISTDVFKNLINYLTKVFAIEFDYSDTPHKYGCYRFTDTLQSPVNGLKVYYKLNVSGTYTIALICPGKSLRPLMTTDIFEFIIRAKSLYCLRFTRIDIRLDDYRKRVSFGYLHRLAVRGDVAGAQKRLYMNGGVIGDKGDSKSESMYLGSKRQQLNVYNADFLHNIDAYRWEGRFRENRCLSIIDFISNNYEDFTDNPRSQLAFLLQYLGNKVLAIAKFIKRNGDKKQSISRFERYPFYQSLLDDVGELDPELLKVEPEPKLNTYEFVRKSFDWLNKQVFKRIQLLIQSFGKSFFLEIFEDCLDSASKRFTNADYIRLVDTKLFIDDIKSCSLSVFYRSLIPN